MYEVKEELFEVENLYWPLLLGRRPVKVEKPKMENYPEMIRRSYAKHNQEMSFFTKLFMKRIIRHYGLMQTLYLEDNAQYLEESGKVQSVNKKRCKNMKRNWFHIIMKRYEEKRFKNFDQDLESKYPQSIALLLAYFLDNID